MKASKMPPAVIVGDEKKCGKAGGIQSNGSKGK